MLVVCLFIAFQCLQCLLTFFNVDAGADVGTQFCTPFAEFACGHVVECVEGCQLVKCVVGIFRILDDVLQSTDKAVETALADGFKETIRDTCGGFYRSAPCVRGGLTACYYLLRAFHSSTQCSGSTCILCQDAYALLHHATQCGILVAELLKTSTCLRYIRIVVANIRFHADEYVTFSHSFRDLYIPLLLQPLRLQLLLFARVQYAQTNRWVERFLCCRSATDVPPFQS